MLLPKSCQVLLIILSFFTLTKCDEFGLGVFNWLLSLEQHFEIKIVTELNFHGAHEIPSESFEASVTSSIDAEVVPNHRLCVAIIPNNSSSFHKMLAKVYDGNFTLSKSTPYNFIFWPIESTRNDHDPGSEITNERNLHQIRQYCKYLTVDTSLFVVVANTKDVLKKHKIFDLYCVNNILIFEEIINAELTNSENSFTEMNRKLFRRRNFHRLPLRIAFVADEDNIHEVSTQEVNGTIHFVSGSSVSLLRDLARLLNFSHVNIKGDWVTIWPNGSFKGNTSEYLKNGLVDLQLSVSTMLPYRATEFRFLQPSYYGGIKAYFRQPSSSSIRDIYISPFRPNLWIAIVVTWILVISCTRIFSWILLKQSYIRNKLSLGWRVDERCNYESFIWAIGTVCQQGWYKHPRGLPLRIVFLSGSFVGLLCYIVYSAAIVSTLSVRVVPITSFTKLMESSFQVYADSESSTMKYILENLKIKHYHERVQGYLTLLQGLELIMKRKEVSVIGFSHIFYAKALQKGLTGVAICTDIYEVNVNESPYQNAILIPKNSPYREYLNYRIIQLKEWGLNQRYMAHFIHSTSVKCDKTAVNKKAGLGIHDVFTAFMIILMGHIFSLAILFIEIVVHYWSSRSSMIFQK